MSLISTQVLTLALVGAEAAALGLWLKTPSQRTDATLPAASLAMAAAAFISIVVVYSHFHSVQSSALASIYLSVTMLLDVTKARSYLERNESELTAIASLALTSASAKFVIVVLEEISKRDLLIDEELRKSQGKEEFCGFWNRSLFLWLNKTLFLGFCRIIRTTDLPNLACEFSSEALWRAFAPVWAKSKLYTTYPPYSQLTQLTKPIYS